MRKATLFILLFSMNTSSLHNALARGIFAMHESHAATYLPLATSILMRQTGFAASSIKPVLNAKSVSMISGKEIAYSANNEQAFSKSETGSIAIVPITGPIMKYDTCESFGTISIAEVLLSAIANPNIVGIVLDMDTPGGELYGTKTLTDIIANSAKPIVAHINDGICASGGMYIACAARLILMAQPTDSIGSIGVYSTLVDSKGALEKKGWVIKEIYSPLSPEKNLSFRKAIDENDLSLREAELRFMDTVFMDTVRKHRGEKLNEKALEGNMFFTDDAISMGLCDGYATQKEAMQQCFNLSQTNQIVKFS